MWIGGFCIVGAGAHASIFMVRDYDPTNNYNNVLDRVIRHRDSIIAHLNWVCIFLGLHSFGLYIHNDTMSALGRPQDMFTDTAIQLQPVFAQWVQNTHVVAPQLTAPGADVATSLSWGGNDIVAVGGKVAMMPISLGTADFLVHHIHAFTIHVTALILLKGTLFSRSSRLIPDKANLGFRFPCDGPGRGGTCQVSGWDNVFLGLFWMYNSISIVIFHFSWKMQSDVWGRVTSAGTVSHITGGNFAQSATTINGWLRDFLWAQSSQVIQSYGSALSAYGLMFLGAHFVWAFSLMFLFSGRGYWQELIESIIWAHNKLKVAPTIQPRALSISQGHGPIRNDSAIRFVDKICERVTREGLRKRPRTVKESIDFLGDNTFFPCADLDSAIVYPGDDDGADRFLQAVILKAQKNLENFYKIPCMGENCPEGRGHSDEGLRPRGC